MQETAHAEGGMGVPLLESILHPSAALGLPQHAGRGSQQGGEQRLLGHVGLVKVVQRHSWQTCLPMSLSRAAPTSSLPPLPRTGLLAGGAAQPPPEAAFPPCGFVVNKYPVFMPLGFSGM